VFQVGLISNRIDLCTIPQWKILARNLDSMMMANLPPVMLQPITDYGMLTPTLGIKVSGFTQRRSECLHSRDRLCNRVSREHAIIDVRGNSQMAFLILLNREQSRIRGPIFISARSLEANAQSSRMKFACVETLFFVFPKRSGCALVAKYEGTPGGSFKYSLSFLKLSQPHVVARASILREPRDIN